MICQIFEKLTRCEYFNFCSGFLADNYFNLGGLKYIDYLHSTPPKIDLKLEDLTCLFEMLMFIASVIAKKGLKMFNKILHERNFEIKIGNPGSTTLQLFDEAGHSVGLMKL